MTTVALGPKSISRTHIQGIIKNRKRSGYVDRQQARSTDRNLKLLIFQKMITTVNEVNNDKKKNKGTG